MPNLRVIYDNLASSATLTASTTSGSLVASNMLNDIKASVHRSAGVTVSYSLIWAASQTVGAVALPATNLSPTATIRVQLYSDTAGTALIHDSNVQPACPSTTTGLHGWGPMNANAFAFGGASKVAVWLPVQPENVRRCVITLDDSNNLSGRIDCSRIVVGPYWEADRNPSYGGSTTNLDMTKALRTDSGDCVVNRGAIYQTMSLSVADMTEESRATLAKILRSAGSYKNMFYSLLPENDQASAEQDHMIYGKRANGPFTFDYFNGFSTKFELEGW